MAVVWDDSNTEWDNLEGVNFSSGHTQEQGDFYSVLSADFDERIFTLGSTDTNNPLPVELVYFKGRKSQEGITLSWQTASELNNEYFEVEVSEDGENFRTIARIAGAGTSSRLNNYEWLHQSPYLGLNYYRLKQTDFDGSVEYSDIIVVNNDLEINLYLSVYPQPASKTVIMEIISTDYDNDMQLVVVNTSGKVIEKIDINADQRDVTMEIANYKNGLYLIHLLQSSHVYNGKLLIQH